MKKRLISLCLALAFVLAALPGNLVSLAADSIGDLAGDEAAGVWGDFSDWVVIYEEGSFKEESVTLYYNPGTQPNNTVTLTGEDVPASFLVEYMMPLTAADGTVSYWYMLNTDEWAAFAGADVCPPYVRVEDVTDLTYLEVQGAADGVFAEFEAVDASTAPEQVDTSHMSGVTSIRGYDISLKDENGATWQPKDNGTTVTVRVYDAWDITVENPIVDIYHVHGDGTVEVLSNTTGDVTLWPDGSVSFETDSFSNYYVVLGYGFGDSTITNGDNIDVYVEPGETIRFNTGLFDTNISGASWTLTSGQSNTNITADGDTVIVGANAAIGNYQYTVSWNSWGSKSAIVTIHVSARRDILKDLIENENNQYGIILSILQPSGNGAYDLPSEPGSTRDNFYNFSSTYQFGSPTNWGATPAYVFSETSKGFVDPKIADHLVKSVTANAKNAGFADATGEILMSYLSNISWDRMMQVAIAQGWRATDGKRMNDPNVVTDDYTVIPYVAKLMGSDNRWHIDCAIVYAKRLTLSYNLNLDNYTVTNSIQLPDTKTGVLNEANTSLTVNPVGSISGMNNNTISASYNGGSAWTLKFVEWNTKPDGSGDSYGPNDPITISENTTLYAIWEGRLVPGDLYVYKDVVVEENATETNKKYQFTVEFGAYTIEDGDPTPTYAIYNAENVIQGTSQNITTRTINFELEDGWYAVFRDVPANTSYTVTETSGDDYKTEYSNRKGSVRNGGTVTVEVTNTYEAKATITYQPVGNGSVDPGSETIKEVTGTAAGSTATPNVGYKFVGWYKDEACTQPVDAAWVSDNKITPQKNNEGKYVTATYYAKFEEIKVEIKYEVDGPADCGTVSPTQQTVGVVSGTPASTAAASSNVYKFVGWYDKDGNLLSTDATYKPAKNADGLHVAATYYAKFEYNLTSLTIVKDGWESIDPNQTFIFNVKNADNSVNLDVTVHGNGSVTIDGLTVGATYTITEKTDWSWRYQCTGWTHGGDSGDSNVATITLGLNGTITFTNTRPVDKWLDGDSWCDNIFSQSAN